MLTLNTISSVKKEKNSFTLNTWKKLNTYYLEQQPSIQYACNTQKLILIIIKLKNQMK